MPRPMDKRAIINRQAQNTTTERYTCSFTRKQLDGLRSLAREKSRQQNTRVSVQDLIRQAINRTFGGKYTS